jgi:hypothetical protein
MERRSILILSAHGRWSRARGEEGGKVESSALVAFQKSQNSSEAGLSTASRFLFPSGLRLVQWIVATSLAPSMGELRAAPGGEKKREAQKRLA